MQSTSSLHPFRGTADHIVMGLPTKVDAVRQTLQTLRAHGISDDQIGLAMEQVGGDMSLGGRTQSLRPRRSCEGAVGGSIIGGPAGLLTATVSSPFQVEPRCWQVRR